jgi:uncharacterized protein
MTPEETLAYTTHADRETQNRNGKLRTFTGRLIDPFNARPEDINSEDLAHQLALTCRYTGACPEHYSVAQHSVYVSDDLYRAGHPPEVVLAGLLHDAEEAYMCDMPSPVKAHPCMAEYKAAGRRLRDVIFARYGLKPYASYEQYVKPFDEALYHQERLFLWHQPGAPHRQAWEAGEAEETFQDTLSWLISYLNTGVNSYDHADIFQQSSSG